MLIAVFANGARAETDGAVGRPWQGTLGVGTTAVSANNVLPIPLALGASLLVERGPFGLEGAVHFDAGTICDHASASDGYCGLLWIFDIAPRATLGPGWAWSPYVSVRFQLTSSDSHGWVPALGPRAGVRYRGRTLGLYAEAGPSFVSSDDGRFGAFVSEGRWFPQVSAGMTINVW
jgi:hypothetical protein